MRKLNKICNKIDSQAESFIPELVDIICLEVPNLRFANDEASEGCINAQGTVSTGNSSGNSKQLFAKDLAKRGFNPGAHFIPDMSKLSTICVVMEFIDTDLDQIFKHKIDFGENHMIKITYSTLCSIAFCHEANVMHRDLKSANILLTSDCNTKICDFGLSRTMAQGNIAPTALNTQNVRLNAHQALQRIDENMSYEDKSTAKMWNDNKKK